MAFGERNNNLVVRAGFIYFELPAYIVADFVLDNPAVGQRLSAHGIYEHNARQSFAGIEHERGDGGDVYDIVVCVAVVCQKLAKIYAGLAQMELQ